jgi:hypothetical protein
MLIAFCSLVQVSATQLRLGAVPNVLPATSAGPHALRSSENGSKLQDWAPEEFNRFHAALNASKVSGKLVRVGRPSCAADIPSDNPYWGGQDKYGMGHHKCIHAGKPEAAGVANAKSPCPYISNRYRVDALRRLLKVTHTLMVNLKVDYMLYGGSAIGQYRCKDVLPWDVDNDILVPRKDIFRMHQVIYGRPWRDLMTNETEYGDLGWGYSEYSVDLSHWGLPFGYKLMKKSNCVIYQIVDMKSGFSTDIFPVDYLGGRGLVPWPGTKNSCNTWTKCSNVCYSYADATYWPIVDCEMSGITMKCANNQAEFLKQTYNENVLTTPDVWVGTF